MSDPLITIKNLTKRYRIYQRPIERLRDAIGLRADYKEFDALDDVSFDVRAGEFWGILGKNGSGKSTLLKIVAGLLQPTTGSVETHGKLALLQLGLGFDPEQTGLENIKQSRLLQNLTSDYGEVAEFIADFSELGDFINYPVKTYSSGMHSRLAFATAIAGTPDILIADEVLAVGDMNFAQKCLSKMRQFKEDGKTIILVTHDINAVKSFCDHGVWLNEGKLVTLGTAKAVAEDFRNFMLYGVRPPTEAETESKSQDATSLAPAGDAGDRWITPNRNRRSVSTGKVAIDQYRFASEATGRALTILTPGEIILLEFDFRVLVPTTIHSFGFTIHDRHGMIAIHVNSLFFKGDTLEVSEGDNRIARFRFEVPMLASGDYSISFGCSEGIDGDLLEKYDHDSVIAIQHGPSSATNEQGGYAIIPSGEFQYAT